MAENQGVSKEDYERKEKEVGEENMRKIEKFATLRTLDMIWMDHLGAMDHLKDSVRLKAYGHQDPLVAYKTEGHRLFGELLRIIESSIVQNILKAEIRREPAFKPQTNNISSTAYHPKTKKAIGRNDPCPCGSEKKYKKCCWPKYG